MMSTKWTWGIAPLLVVLSGCATDSAVFVTKTSLSIIDLDTTPPEISLAYHRVEGFIAPRNKNGDAPPVLANLKSDGTLLTPKIQQVYATGSAAETLVGADSSENSSCNDCEDTPEATPVIFTTSTTLGLKFSFSATNVIDGLVLGFRRKELSVVPKLAKDTDGNYHYPSLIATLKTGAGPGQAGTGEYDVCQGFASGSAATALAKRIEAGEADTLGCSAVSIRANLLGEYRGSLERQRSETAEVLRCYVALQQSNKPNAWNDAQRHGLFADPSGADQNAMIRASKGPLEDILKEQAKANDLPKAEERLVALRQADGLYASYIMDFAAGQKDKGALRGNTLREQLLRAHREFVCAEARK